MPPELFFSVPQYNTWIELTYNQNQKDDGNGTATNIVDPSYQCDLGVARAALSPAMEHFYKTQASYEQDNSGEPLQPLQPIHEVDDDKETTELTESVQRTFHFEKLGLFHGEHC